MASQVELVGIYGAEPGTLASLTDLAQRFNTAIPSQRDPGLSKPCNVPPAESVYYSVPIFTGLRILGGTYSQLTNFRFFSSNNIKSTWQLNSGKVQIALKDQGDPGMPYSEYMGATGTDGLTGADVKDPDDGIPYFKDEQVACADADSYTSSMPLTFDTNVYTPTTAHVTLFVCQQLVLMPNTAFGDMAELNTGYRWQEI